MSELNVEQRLSFLESEVRQLKQKLSELEESVSFYSTKYWELKDELNTSINALSPVISGNSQSIMEMQAFDREVEVRLSKLEGKPHA